MDVIGTNRRQFRHATRHLVKLPLHSGGAVYRGLCILRPLRVFGFESERNVAEFLSCVHPFSTLKTVTVHA